MFDIMKHCRGPDSGLTVLVFTIEYLRLVRGLLNADKIPALFYIFLIFIIIV